MKKFIWDGKIEWDMTCNLCYFYHNESGQCRRQPPSTLTSVADFNGRVYGNFPYIDKGCWCGEFRPNEGVMGKHVTMRSI